MRLPTVRGAGARWPASPHWFVLHTLLPQTHALRTVATLLQAVLALLLVWIEPRAGTAPVLLVMLVAQAQAGMTWPPLRVLLLALVLNAGMYAVVSARRLRSRLVKPTRISLEASRFRCSL